VDGVGEWATTTYSKGTKEGIDMLEEVHFPILWSVVQYHTSYLGFGVNDGEYKVWGLAPYGKPIYTDKNTAACIPGSGGQFRLDMKILPSYRSVAWYSGHLIDLFGKPARKEDEAYSAIP